MREIKFRAWDYTSNVMRNDITEMVFNSDGTLNQINVETGADILFPEKECVLMQYTGLKDKNGVEIYEGDIVDDHYFESYVSRHKVHWADNYGCWSTLGLTFPVSDRKQLDYLNQAKILHRNECLEVIGNIYEHSHLLKNETKD